MNNIRVLLLLLISFGVLGFACSKKQVVIGRDNPDQEIQKCIKLSDKKHFKEAIDCLEMFKTRFPKSQWGMEAELHIGDNYFRKKEYLLAADSYQAFLRLYPMSPKADYAHYKTGLSYLRFSPKALDRDQEYLEPAIMHFEIVQRNYPDSPYAELNNNYHKEARTRIAKRHFYIGRFYFKTGEYISSIPRFLEIANNYRDSGLGDKALYYATIANLRLKKIDGARDTFSKLSLDYSGSRYINELEGRMLRAVK